MSLKDDPRIPVKLRSRLRTAAERAGYFPNDLPNVLLTGRTGLMGLVVPLVNSPFVSGFLDAALEVIWKSGRISLVLCSELNLDREEEMLRRLARQRVEGVILMPAREDRGKKHVAALLKDHVPLVAFDNPIPKLNLPLVTSDDLLGGRLAAQHLIKLGHRRIAHIGCPWESPYADRRRETGYRQAMIEAGLTPRIVPLDRRINWLKGTRAVMQQLMASVHGQPPTAVFGFNDDVAIGVYDFCREHGIRIPADLSVVGYGDQHWRGDIHPWEHVAPPLTTVRQNALAMGTAAGKLLLQLIERRKAVPAQTLVPPLLVTRQSTAPSLER